MNLTKEINKENLNIQKNEISNKATIFNGQHFSIPKNKNNLRVRKSISMKNANFNFRNAKMNLEINLSKETNSKNENNSINVNSITKIEIKSCMSNFNEKMKLKLDNERNSRINSLEMEIILKNQSKLYKKGSKNEEFIEFYINDNNKNSIYNLKDNTIYTTKYNLFSFIPKGL